LLQLQLPASHLTHLLLLQVPLFWLAQVHVLLLHGQASVCCLDMLLAAAALLAVAWLLHRLAPC
jgi:hypothetical protein